MPEVIEVSSLIENGDVVHNIEGTNLESVYHNACMHFNLPEGLSVDSLEKELLDKDYYAAVDDYDNSILFGMDPFLYTVIIYSPALSKVSLNMDLFTNI